jgi:DNA-binding NarL/FixJ family response regulator
MATRIMIVDDVLLVRLGLRLMMEEHEGWTVCGEAQDGEEAVRKAAELDPDVILLDVSMPKMNGLAAAPLLREQVPNAQIVMLTLYPSLDMAREAARVGAAAFVSKTMVARDLTPAIEALEAARPVAAPPGANPV